MIREKLPADEQQLTYTSGSANGFCLNSLGMENGFSIPFACLNVIKGQYPARGFVTALI